MPTSARKSSLGAARRAQQRAHLPFHADNLGLGKRTGLPVPTIDHKSDDFEPFDEILSHADARAGWQGQNKRPGSNKKRKSVVPLYEEDDGGEMSMELDDYSGPVNTSANVYFSHTRQPSSPLANRAGSSSRRVARASDVDFDAVPSPRPRGSLISNLRRSSIAHPLRSSHAPLDTSDDVHFDDGGGGGGLYDEDAEMESPEPRSRLSRQHETPRRATLLGSEDESSPNTRSKGKRRAMQVNDEGGDNQVEDEIAQGLDDAEMQQEDEDEEVAEPPPKKKKAAEKRLRKRELPVVPLSPENGTGLRRGKRLRYEPLEWWRCEKVVYGRRDPGKVSYVPTIKEIVRIPKDLPKPLSGAYKSKRRGTRSKTEETVSVVNPEDGWDDKTATNGVVIDWFTGNEVSRRLAFPGRMVQRRPAANSDFFFTKVFGDGEYIAAGQLRIPPNKHKPSKMTKDNTYVFYVIDGAVTFKVHESSYVLCAGGMILVPRGNTYYIENIAERDAKLFFAQARRVSAEEEAPPEVLPALDHEPTTTPHRRRSNSIGQAPVTARLSSEKAAPGKRAASARS